MENVNNRDCFKWIGVGILYGLSAIGENSKIFCLALAILATTVGCAPGNVVDRDYSELNLSENGLIIASTGANRACGLTVHMNYIRVYPATTLEQIGFEEIKVLRFGVSYGGYKSEFGADLGRLHAVSLPPGIYEFRYLTVDNYIGSQKNQKINFTVKQGVISYIGTLKANFDEGCRRFYLTVEDHRGRDIEMLSKRMSGMDVNSIDYNLMTVTRESESRE